MFFQPRLTFGAILFIMIQFFTRLFLLRDFAVIVMGLDTGGIRRGRIRLLGFRIGLSFNSFQGGNESETLFREMLRLPDRNRVFQRVLFCFFDMPAGSYPGLPGSAHGRSFYEPSQAL